ncbi:hypothetical protein EYF80_049860 [Liparis tanakae]|uniref:Uncharacterized protein n=1 Tax=Liparis tanakae TaxID=230148 RepID=A0A4Z2FGS3_9TELE|nr:hypothetical protein EYF80_049860 [Liparis tanakae]
MEAGKKRWKAKTERINPRAGGSKFRDSRHTDTCSRSKVKGQRSDSEHAPEAAISTAALGRSEPRRRAFWFQNGGGGSPPRQEHNKAPGGAEPERRSVTAACLWDERASTFLSCGVRGRPLHCLPARMLSERR